MANNTGDWPWALPSVPSFTAGDTCLCGHCGMHHSGSCPHIKAVEYYPDGTVKHVEYYEPKPIIGGSNA